MSARLRIRKKGDTEETVIDLPPVQTYEYSFQSNLTEISTMVYGYRNNFCMDLGNTMRINVSFERINPQPYNDSSKDPNLWSNGKWYRYLESCLDYWQNNAVDVDNPSVQAGGARFEFVPDDLELFPVQGYNVFVIGNLNMTYKTVQTMAFTLPMVASRMIGEAEPLEKIELTLYSTAYGSASGMTKSYFVPKGYNVMVPSLPDEWVEIDIQPGQMFVGWTDPQGNMYNAGTLHAWTAPTTLTAVWKGALAVYAYYPPDCVETDIPLQVPAGATLARAFIVGGGGGAGGASNKTAANHVYFTGGGGGAGEALELPEREVLPYSGGSGNILTLHVGAGGAGGHNATAGQGSSDGKDGSSSYIYISSYSNGSEISKFLWGSEARGGQGGTAAETYGNTGGTAGKLYYAGGEHIDRINGGDGSTASPNILGNVGKGGKGYMDEGNITGAQHPNQGGNGGGASAYRYRFRDDKGVWHPSVTGTYYESKGGNGYDQIDDTYATDGKLGGGGGSGKSETQYAGSGGDGAVVIVFYA